VSENQELLQFFVFAHLPVHLQAVSQPFSEVALRCCRQDAAERRAEEWEHGFMDVFRKRMERELPANSQRAACVGKLHEAGDAVCEMHDLGDVLQLLLEAKDCAVRAVLYKPVQP
jgi:hypothetical protein